MLEWVLGCGMMSMEFNEPMILTVLCVQQSESSLSEEVISKRQ